MENWKTWHLVGKIACFCQGWLLPMVCYHCVLMRTYLCYPHSVVDVLHQETYYSSAEKGGPVAKGWGSPVSWRGCCIPNCCGWTLGWRLASQSWEVEQPVGAGKTPTGKRNEQKQSPPSTDSFYFSKKNFKFQTAWCLEDH